MDEQEPQTRRKRILRAEQRLKRRRSWLSWNSAMDFGAVVDTFTTYLSSEGNDRPSSIRVGGLTKKDAESVSWWLKRQGCRRDALSIRKYSTDNGRQGYELVCESDWQA